MVETNKKISASGINAKYYTPNIIYANFGSLQKVHNSNIFLPDYSMLYEVTMLSSELRLSSFFWSIYAKWNIFIAGITIK